MEIIPALTGRWISRKNKQNINYIEIDINIINICIDKIKEFIIMIFVELRRTLWENHLG